MQIPEAEQSEFEWLDRDLTKLDDKSLFEHLAALPGGMKWRRLAVA